MSKSRWHIRVLYYTYTQSISAFISVGSRVLMNDLSLISETREKKQKGQIPFTYIVYINLINEVRVYNTILNNNFNIKDWWQKKKYKKLINNNIILRDFAFVQFQKSDYKWKELKITYVRSYKSLVPHRNNNAIRHAIATHYWSRNISKKIVSRLFSLLLGEVHN